MASLDRAESQVNRHHSEVFPPEIPDALGSTVEFYRVIAFDGRVVLDTFSRVGAERSAETHNFIGAGIEPPATVVTVRAEVVSTVEAPRAEGRNPHA